MHFNSESEVYLFRTELSGLDWLNRKLPLGPKRSFDDGMGYPSAPGD
jgi:hypothetical protein